VSRKIPTYGPQRAWWYRNWTGWPVVFGGDEFCNRTIVFRFVPTRIALVVNLERPMRNRPCDECRADMSPDQVRAIAGVHRY